MNYIRLKTSLDEKQVQDRLQYDPEIIELHLEEEDLINTKRLIKTIRTIKMKGIQVYLHHPMKVIGKKLDILSTDPEVLSYYRTSTYQLIEICKLNDVKCVIHAHYEKTESSDHLTLEKTRMMKDKIEELLLKGRDVLLWEDTIEGLFSYENPYLINEIIKPLNLPLIVDISHAFIALKGDNLKLNNVLNETKEYARYYHVVDSMGEFHDGLELGKGKVDWEMVKPYIHSKPFIFEIALQAPYDNCLAMIRSADYYNQIEIK